MGEFGLVVNFFFNTLIHNEIFFFDYALANYFFRPLTFCRNFFFCVDGVEKVGIPLLLLATLAAVLFNSNIGARFSLSCSLTAQPSKCARWPMCQTTHLKCIHILHCHAFYIYICTEDHNRLYCLHICKLLNSLIFIKRHLSTLSFFVIFFFLYALGLFGLHISFPNT